MHIFLGAYRIVLLSVYDLQGNRTTSYWLWYHSTGLVSSSHLDNCTETKNTTNKQKKKKKKKKTKQVSSECQCIIGLNANLVERTWLDSIKHFLLIKSEISYRKKKKQNRNRIIW